MNQWQFAPSNHYAQAYYPQQPQYNPPPQVSAPRYQPGSSRCTHKQCTFSGPQKVVELHMMDRHLIYPPGHSKRKKDDDWDADPSLKGKPIVIQGTNVSLNTPEDIAAWIAERRKRYPTADHVSDKKEKLEEAIARGQLHLENPRFPKRQRLDNDLRGAGRGRGRGRGAPSRGRGTATSRPELKPATFHPLPPRPPPAIASYSSSGSDDDDDGPPEAVSSKSTMLPPVESNAAPLPEPESMSVPQSTIKKPFVRQPKNPPTNPFASKPSLLRNLLLPEIKNTVSNLSQAIRFLVDNDFLENVELKPGDAEAQSKIQVIGE